MTRQRFRHHACIAAVHGSRPCPARPLRARAAPGWRRGL